MNFLVSNPPAGLLPFRLERISEDAGGLVGAHPNEHGYEAVDPLLHRLADVLVHVDCPGLPLVDRLADGAKDH